MCPVNAIGVASARKLYNCQSCSFLDLGRRIDARSKGIEVLRSRHNTDGATPDTGDELDNGLDLGVIESIRGRVSVDTHGIDSALVSRVES